VLRFFHRRIVFSNRHFTALRACLTPVFEG